MTDLSTKKCEACNRLTPKLTPEQVAEMLDQVPGWEVANGTHLSKQWKFKDFAQALQFVNAISVVAEQEGHHPDISFGWGYVDIMLMTHAIIGLSENDFILAAKIDTL